MYYSTAHLAEYDTMLCCAQSPTSQLQQMGAITLQNLHSTILMMIFSIHISQSQGASDLGQTSEPTLACDENCVTMVSS